MLDKVRIMAIAAATLLASPAFAGSRRAPTTRPPMSCGQFEVGSTAAALSIECVNIHTKVT